VALLELEGVSFGYGPPGRRTEVLADINLAIEEGEFVAIAGYSGSGKTTLMSLIAGLIQPDRGRITLDGRPLAGPGPDRGVVFQNYSLLPWLSVLENVSLAVGAVFPDWPAEQRKSHSEKYIDLVNLTPAKYKRPAQLSGGMRQRVSVARALAMNPRMLLLDEPFGALDALTRGTLQQELARIWSSDSKTVLMITNDVDEGLLLADRVVPLSVGPRATLGPATNVDLPRPRDRRQLQHDARYKQLKQQVLGYLLGEGRRRPATTTAGSPAAVAVSPVSAAAVSGSTGETPTARDAAPPVPPVPANPDKQPAPVMEMAL
jgi:nitrate/nitrite transport system ATP-binding protein